MKGKQGKTANWLPNMVVYGMDTSSPNPKDWVPFGDYASESTAESASSRPKSASGLPTPPAQARP